MHSYLISYHFFDGILYRDFYTKGIFTGFNALDAYSTLLNTLGNIIPILDDIKAL